MSTLQTFLYILTLLGRSQIEHKVGPTWAKWVDVCHCNIAVGPTSIIREKICIDVGRVRIYSLALPMKCPFGSHFVCA